MRFTFCRGLIALVVACVFASAAVAQGTSTAAQSPATKIAPAQGDSAQGELAYRLGSGDQVRVTVFGHRDLSGEFHVDGSGMVAMPLIDGVRADGLTLDEFETAIADKLKPDYLKNPRVSVDVLNYRPFYILGEVKNPGSYPFVNGMTVVNAVALAGGFTYRAQEKSMFITRGGDKDRGKEKVAPDAQVLPGDIIEVPERFF